MVKDILKQFKKKIFHILTSGNADIAFYTEAYVASNKEWVMKRPVLFAINLLKINFYCLVLHKNYSIKELVPGRKCIARIHRRPKVYQYSADLMKYPFIITDIFHSLLELSEEIDTIYQRIEKNYNLPGFYDLRKKKANNYITIDNIYEELSRDLSVTLSKDIEINMLKKYLVLNPYLKKALEIAAYNNSSIIGILETSYSKEDIEDILNEFSIKLSDIHVSSEEKRSFSKMRNELIKQHTPPHVRMEEMFVIVSANYKKAFQTSRSCKFTNKYYRSSKEIMKSITLPEITAKFKEVYQTITGIELFGGLYSHKNIYEITYLYLAPAIYAFLRETYLMAVNSSARVIALCDPENIFATLYAKYFGELDACIWSGFSGSIPASREDWNKLIEDCSFIKALPADRIAASFGFSFPNQLLKDCQEEFVEEALKKSRCKSKEAILKYLKPHLGEDKNLVIVDPMPGLFSLNYFVSYIKDINPQLDIQKLSMSHYLNKNAKELSVLHHILQMDSPIIMGIYGDEINDCPDHATQLKEITFTQPNMIDETKKEIIQKALEDYCRSFASYQRKNPDLEIYPSDINLILEHSREGLILLEEELGGYIE
jgi:hypothetical protein